MIRKLNIGKIVKCCATATSSIVMVFLLGCGSLTEHPKVKREILEQCFTESNREVLEYPINSEANVLNPAKIKAYGVGRYQDPNNSKIMHERHVIYRMEEEPSWRYNVDASRQILIGNTLTNSRCSYQPALLDKEVALELKKQRITNRNLKKVYQDMLELCERMETSQYECLKAIEIFLKTTSEPLVSSNNDSEDIPSIASGEKDMDPSSP